MPEFANPISPLRRIRSFVRREGRLTPAQARALTTLWPRYGLMADQILDPKRAFLRPAPLIVEIGFGNGEGLLETAAQYPAYNYLGIEVHRPGIGHLLLGLEQLRLANVRILCADAVDVFNACLSKETCHRINVFFPDPWPKKRHHKRRLIQPQFAALLSSRLQRGGILHLATDWPDYAQHMQNVLGSCPELKPLDPKSLVPPRPSTKYAARALSLGHSVYDLAYRKS